eukprot:TRINITY_DN12017_c0_g1_i1.p1 TRINITY_DN12017_c0_g1~~TRINITY_DN12017_c0_g1_i1.p1  ORF type:complete len:381 (+),score=126.14 TRINITY_DN12017_c0_g1_i1:97-1239(+)
MSNAKDTETEKTATEELKEQKSVPSSPSTSASSSSSSPSSSSSSSSSCPSPSLEAQSPPASPKSKEQKELEDETLKLSREKVAAAKADTSGRVYRVYCDGIFDLFHIGHMKMMEQAKKLLGAPEKTYLLIGVNTDEDTHKRKGKTVMDQKTRCESVRHCKWVDEVVEDPPWELNEDFLIKHKIDFVAHDAIPYVDKASGQKDVYAFVKERGCFMETQRTPAISTSDLIVAILKDYDDFIKRNLSRGYTKEDLNVGQTWEMRALAHQKAKTVKEKWAIAKQRWESLSHDAKSWILDFDPRYLVHVKRDSKSKVSGLNFTPKEYQQHLKQVPSKTKGLFTTLWGFGASTVSIAFCAVSYINPLPYCWMCMSSCCCGRKKKKE